MLKKKPNRVSDPKRDRNRNIISAVITVLLFVAVVVFVFVR